MKALLLAAVTVCLFGEALCCYGFPPQETTTPAPATTPAATPCPPGVNEVFCFVDPCRFATCAAHPDATCISNYCGGCNAVFYDINDNEVNCDDPYCPSGDAYLPGIFCGRGPNRQDCPPTHSCQVHPADAWAVCCPNSATVGECPDTTGMVGACAEFCSSDADCSGGQRCCSNGCGHACMDVNRG
ncbi:waprin-Phi1-like [Branchiostoma floridae]|uniref:Waprin-Phi1-like n=1 Tax=Branchiostoma floridae TaxID=7739 RepID=A0A9J7MLA2_BRAFL|nr:waprin-Phi1-like [Branchiostoma floridae]